MQIKIGQKIQFKECSLSDISGEGVITAICNDVISVEIENNKLPTGKYFQFKKIESIKKIIQ